jgi:hypothetical protein
VNVPQFNKERQGRSAGTNPGSGYGSQHQRDLKDRAPKQASRAWRKGQAVRTQPGPRLAPHHQAPNPGAWWEFPIPPSSKRAAGTGKAK